MEGGDDDDEHGSGWFEVKKKHRTSSKLSIQKVSGGSFNKTQPCSPYKASDSEVGSLHNRRQAQIIKDGVGFTTHPKVASDVACSSAVMADNGNDCLDKVMVNKENGPPQALPHTDIEFAASEVKTKVIQESSIKDNLDVSKIKWGDLEDDAFSPFIGYGNPEENFKTKSSGVLDDYVLDHANAMESDELVVSISPCTLQEGKLRKEVVELLPDRTLSSAMQGECLEGTWKEVTEIPSENFEAGNAKSVNASETQHVDRIKRVITDEPEEDLSPNDPLLKQSSSLSVDGPLERTLQESNVRSEEGTSNISELSVINENRDMSFSLQNTILVSHQNDGAEISCDASHTSDTEDSRGLHHSIEGAELGECEEGESKERFRERLWCFLFENLNRAVDELYLLCELECDMDQMNEAILVLEEASSDFKELRCRVEHFENTKRSIPQSSKDGMPVNAKTEHRRPHALSWEVRRMTTSPHRAEILSSSLEAFKKIQLERTRKHVHLDTNVLTKSPSTGQHFSRSSPRTSNLPPKPREPSTNTEKLGENLDAGLGSTKLEKLNGDPSRKTRASSVHNGRLPAESLCASALGKSKREQVEPISESENQLSRKDRLPIDKVDKQLKASDTVRKQISLADKEKEKDKEKRNTAPWKPMDAWKEKRNWEDILKSPLRNSSRVSHSPGLARKGMERVRVLHDKLMSPEKRRKTALDMKREAEEKHARAMRIRSQLESERVQRLQRTSEKLNRVNEWQAGRSLKLREGMHARHQRSESRHEAYLAQVSKRAGDESSKVNEVRFITSLNEENKKLILRQKLHDSEMRRAEKMQVIKTKQKEDTAREEAVLERRKLLEAEKLQRLAETQRKKEEAQVRRDEERKASSAAREAKALEQLRKKEVRARAQQEEAELLAQKLAERLSESEQRRKFYLEQIRERASMDFRDQSSPLLRRSLNKEGQGRPISTNSVEDYQTSFISTIGDSVAGQVSSTQQQSLKRRIKKIRQRLMALKYEFAEPPVGADNSGICYRALVGTARAKIGRWLQDLQKLRQARKDGAASIGLIVGDMVKFLEGKDPELHASRQAGLLDFISSALPASHTSKPEACQVTVYLLRLLRVVLSVPANRSYFLAHNLLPPIIPMLSASLENYIKIAASSIPGSSNILSSKTSTENLESIIEVLDGSLWTVTIIMGYAHTDDRQLQMLDGLLELIVAYQIIHRLRDLFALYDRPQVEGNPFPSSILLSLNLLVVLTSRYRTISPIDWEACISKAASGGEIQDPKSLRYPGIGEFSMQGNSTKHVIVDSLANEVGQMSEEKLQFTMSDVPEIRSFDGEHRNNCLEVANDLGNVETEKQAENTSGEVLLLDENAKKCSPQKGENNLIDGCKEKKGNNDLVAHDNIEIKKECGLRQPIVFLLSSITETGLVGLPSLLTAVLLQANNRLSSEQASYILPSNFEEVATGVLKVLNNLAVLDIILLQKMLARPDLKMEFFHLMSFLLSYCTSKWKAANDQVGLLLLESLLLLGYFALFHPGNQAVLRWGKSPTILHKVCDLPFVFFSDPELTPILASTLVAACFCCDQNRGVVLQELSVDMLLSLLKSCRQGFFTSLSDSSLPESFMVSDQCEGVHLAPQSRRPQGDIMLKLNRRSTRSVLGKGAVSGSTMRASKVKGQRESRGTKTCDEWALKHGLPALETSQTFMLHRRFPTLFLDKAEEFFSAGSSDLPA